MEGSRIRLAGPVCSGRATPSGSCGFKSGTDAQRWSTFRSVLIDERGSMVKRTSRLASNEMFQVRILVELLNMVSVVYAVRTPACEAGQYSLETGRVRLPSDTLWKYRSVLLGSKRPPKPPSRVRFLALLLCRRGRIARRRFCPVH